MARYIGSACKNCRREGMKLYLKGERCYSEKCSFDKRPYAPGQHGRVRKKTSDYGLQLREKQKVRKMYGLLEHQFYLNFVEADRRKGITGNTLLELLETRFDNIVYKMGYANSRNQARQFVTHGFFKVNGKRVRIPSIKIKVGDVITLVDRYKENVAVLENTSVRVRRGVPSWLDFSVDTLTGVVKSVPTREDIQLSINEHLIVEYYSR